MRYTSADGEWAVEVIHLALTGNNRDGEWLRVSRWGCFVAEVRSIAELSAYVNLAELEQALGPFRTSPRNTGRPAMVWRRRAPPPTGSGSPSG